MDIYELESLELSSNARFEFFANKVGGTAVYCNTENKDAVMFLLCTDLKTKKTYEFSQFLSKLFSNNAELSYTADPLNCYFSHLISFEDNLWDLQNYIIEICDDDIIYNELNCSVSIERLSKNIIAELSKINAQENKVEKQKLIYKFLQNYSFKTTSIKSVAEELCFA